MQYEYLSPLYHKIVAGEPLTVQAGEIVTYGEVVTKTFDPECTAIRILNLSIKNTLQFSFDNGDNYLSIPPLGTEDRPLIARNLLLRVKTDPEREEDVEYDFQYTQNR